MTNALCKDSVQNRRWAVSLCFAAATLVGLQSSRPEACAWLGFNPQQSFMLCAGFSTLAVFLGFFILTRMIGSIEPRRE